MKRRKKNRFYATQRLYKRRHTAKYRASLPEDERERIREMNRESAAYSRSSQTEEEKAYARKRNRENAAIARRKRTDEEKERDREKARERAAYVRSSQTEEEKERIRQKARERVAYMRSLQTDEEKERIRQRARERVAYMRSLQTDEEKERIRQRARERAAFVRSLRTNEEKERIRQKAREKMALIRNLKNGKSPEGDLESEHSLLSAKKSNTSNATVTSSDMVVELDPSNFVKSEADPPPESSNRMEPDTSLLELDIHQALTCELYPADDALSTKVEPIDTDFYGRDMNSVAVGHSRLRHLLLTSAASNVEGTLFQPPVLIKEEPVYSEDES